MRKQKQWREKREWCGKERKREKSTKKRISGKKREKENKVRITRQKTEEN